MRRSIIFHFNARKMCIPTLVFLLFSGSVFGESKIAKWYSESAKAIAPVSVELFEPVIAQAAKGAGIQVNELQINQNQFSAFLVNKPAVVTLEIPNGQETVQMNLARVNITAADFTLNSENGPINYEQGVYYRGIVNNDPSTIASFAVFGDEVMGSFSGNSGNYTIGKLGDGSGNYAIYNSGQLPTLSSWGCQDLVATAANQQPTVQYKTTGVGCKTVSVYFECDYQMYVDKGYNASNVANYVLGLFNQVSALYANENVAIQISQITVWTSPDPYMSFTNASDVLYSFRATKMLNYVGDIAHFLSTRSLGGGVAYVGTLCNKAYSYGVSQIYNYYSTVPSYSWSVEVITHEIGHNLGSPHTQSCSWPGGAIDNCYTPEGGCAYGPAPVNGGTIMSYCHITSVGINFANGFGPLPGDKIRSSVLNATCLASSGTSPAGLTTSNITTSSADESWVPVAGATQYHVEYKLSSSTTWTSAGTTSNPNITVTNLTPGTVYQWHVSSDCSAFSSPASFTTLSTTTSACPSPSVLNESNITTNGGSLSWDAIPAATSYTVEYQESNATSWTTMPAVTTNSLNVSGLNSGTIYNWHVKADCSVFSAASSFTTTVIPTGCTAPGNNATTNLTKNSATLTWSGVTGAQSYTIKFHKVGQNNWSNYNNIVGTSKNITGLAASTAYEWKISSKCNGSSSAYSAVNSFNTPASFVMNSDEVKVYPNPAKDIVSIDLYDWAANAEGTAEVSNIQGQLIKTYQVKAGHNQLNIEELPEGILFINLKQQGKETISLKLLRSNL
jgi:hypothetical protein